MDSNGSVENVIARLMHSVKTKGILLNILFFAAGIIISGIFLKSAYGEGFILSFFAGFMAGMLNQHIFFNIARVSISLPSERAAVFATVRFYARFGIAIMLLFLLAWTGLNPVALLIGFSLPLQTTILTVLFTAKKEFRQNA